MLENSNDWKSGICTKTRKENKCYESWATSFYKKIKMAC